MRGIYPPALGVFLILLGSYAFFWHSRDWNTASRLMLTYAMMDRGTVILTGYEGQTKDIAKFEGQYYSDKLPGYPLLAAVPYAALKWGFHVRPHPLNADAMEYWPADYWIALATSGLLTALTGAMLVVLAREIGCTSRMAALVGLAYGLATPAYVYATLAYGHQATAFALLASFLLIREPSPRSPVFRAVLAGFLAASASVVEIQVGPVSAILGLYFAHAVYRRRYPVNGLFGFALGALIPTMVLLSYNMLAFGWPFDMGYFHHIIFAYVHTRNNPLGLEEPGWRRLRDLLLGRYRGLLVYAPILFLSLPGWVVLVRRGYRELAVVSSLVCAAVFMVNLTYQEWTGGWCTGPRLLTPLIPFAMIPVAGLLAYRGRWAWTLALAAAVLAVIGGVEMLLFQGAGARIPHMVWDTWNKLDIPLAEPLRDAVWPLWRGERSARRVLPQGFASNLVAMAAPRWVAGLTPRWRFLQFLPLVVVQALAIAVLMRNSREEHAGAGS